MRLLDFFWPYEPALADEAVSAVGAHADRRIESLARLREMEKLLHANIQREMDALKAVQAAIEREEAADAAMAPKASDSEIETAVDGEFSLIDCTATAAVGVEAKRKRKLTEITSEAA